MARSALHLVCFVCLACGATLAGCSSPSPRTGSAPAAVVPASTGSEIAVRALALLGAPYRYGAAGPAQFDCSGLVRYIHHNLGIGVPRTAAEQYAASRRIDLDELAPGDLVFFRIDGSKVSHVGIYAGDGRFVHAPKTGRPVELRTLNDEYYRPRLAGAGRLF